MIQTAVAGASGYAGAELIALLARHPDVSLDRVCGDSTAGGRWEDLYPGRSHLFTGTIELFDPDALAGLDVVFLALPHGASAAAAARLQDRVGRIIDLSGDLRFNDADEYSRWYGMSHPAPELLGAAIYALPELFGGDIPKARLLACPGCYATVAQLAAAPALGYSQVSSDAHIVAMSGTSGAGRKASLPLSFSEVHGDLRAYRVGRHQHAPEMAAGLSKSSGKPVRVSFVPHLAPIERGIAAAVTLHLSAPLDSSALLDAYETAYANSPFIRVRDPEQMLPSVRHVVGTNFCDLAPVVDEEGSSVVVLATIDNLLKGAAGQAVQVFNLAHDLPETTGLLPVSEGGTA